MYVKTASCGLLGMRVGGVRGGALQVKYFSSYQALFCSIVDCRRQFMSIISCCWFCATGYLFTRYNIVVVGDPSGPF